MGRNKMNNKKTLTSLAAASMVITQAGQMSVFAKGATADPETPAEKEETKVEKTQKELLEEKIKEAQEKLDATKKEADAKKAEAETAEQKTSQEAEKANQAYTAQNTVVQTGYDALNGYIDESLQPLLNEIADLEAKIAQMTVNLNAEQKTSQEAEKAKQEAEKELANKKLH